jgi:hypothetical protein
MKRTVLVVVLVALAAAAPAAALSPGVQKSAIGAGRLRAYATVTPPAAVFGDAITARVTVVADRRWIDPARLQVTTDFAPYEQTRPPTVVRTGSGRFAQETWTWTLRCLSEACVPVKPPSNLFHAFHFAPARVRDVGAGGHTEYKVAARFPLVEEFSAISPTIVTYLKNTKSILWQYQLAPATASAFRVPPALVFWAALCLAAVLGAGGLALAARWVLRLRTPAAAAAPALPSSYLERALALFFWANARGDETLQRKALERVAGELPLDVMDLSTAARELAWSPERPEEDEVEAISERAGVPAHHENGAAE